MGGMSLRGKRLPPQTVLRKRGSRAKTLGFAPWERAARPKGPWARLQRQASDRGDSCRGHEPTQGGPLKIKTFTQSLEIFRTVKEIEELDRQVNDFIASHRVKRIIGVSDATTQGDGGTIGLLGLRAKRLTRLEAPRTQLRGLPRRPGYPQRGAG